MKHVRPLLLAALLPAAAAQSEPTTPAVEAERPPDTAPALQRDTVALAKRVFPSVVTVRTFVRAAQEAPTNNAPAAVPRMPAPTSS